MTHKLSVVIIAYNEEENIGRCIDSVKEIADEVLVVDSFSTDNTVAVATKKGARVVQHKFEGHIQQKNWAKENAAHEYVLSLDADEALSNDLKQSLLSLHKNLDADGYTINRLNFFCGKPIKTCGWYPDTKLRLWNRTKGEWKGINPHDKFELEKRCSIKHLKGDLLHYTYPTRESFLQQREKFADISAQHLKVERAVFLFFKMMFSAPFKFIRNYIFKLGFTEGATGLFICYHQSREVFLKYFRALKLKYLRVRL
ncbi:MAG: glycosyltransferase family 2 protein [Chitinophagales bacterium]|nr:glycosyltransferase family 2 protein [Chitinophagales bacterium]